LFLSGGGREEAVKKVIEAVLSNQVVLQLQIAIKQKVNPAHGVPMAGAINALKVAASPHLYPAAAAQAPVSAAASTHTAPASAAPAAPAPGQILTSIATQYQTRLTDLNSSIDNVFIGPARRNRSIGTGLDLGRDVPDASSGRPRAYIVQNMAVLGLTPGA
jgi:hypothetical protein